MTSKAQAFGSRARAMIERVRPEVDAGKYPIKRTVGETVIVEADIFADGHDQLRCLLLHRPSGTAGWKELFMLPLGNDRWQASFNVAAPGRHEYTVSAWVDRFLTWRHDLGRRQDPADIAVALQVGIELLGCIGGNAEHGKGQFDPAGLHIVWIKVGNLDQSVIFGRLAVAEHDWRFTEWFNDERGTAEGMAGQTWNAALFLLARESLQTRIF